MLKKIASSYTPQILLVVVISIFFARLFLPLSIFTTPDIGRSDLLHFNIPIKNLLSESLKNYQLPLWEPNMGQGYPVLDEGQIGFFYLPNLLLFKLLPFTLAFNLGYVVTFLISSLGTYFLARSLKLEKHASYLAAITFAFCPIFTLHIHHYNLIQTASLAPWIFWCINSFFEKKKAFYLFLFPLILSQQIFTGFAQLTFYTLFGAFLFFIFKLYVSVKEKSSRYKISLVFTLIIALAFLISSVQIAANYNLLKESGRLQKQDPKQILSDFPLKPKNLATAINPYIWGSPQNATYPRWEPGKWSVFWESNIYFGLVQLILIGALTISFVFKKPKRVQPYLLFFYALALLSLLLALGQSAPLHPIFSFPPFSMFRVPARFLILTFLSTSIIAAYSLQKLAALRPEKITRIIILALLLTSSLDVFRAWYGYQMTGKAKEWLQAPQIADNIAKQERVFAIFENKIWNETFLEKGWQNKEDDYLFYRNMFARNLPMQYGISSFLPYAGMTTRRMQLIERFSTYEIKDEGDKVTIGPVSQKMLQASGVNYLTSKDPVESPNWYQKDVVQTSQNKIFLYQSTNPAPRVFSVVNYKVAQNVNQITEYLKSDELDPSKTVILESQPKIDLSQTDQAQNNSVKITNYQNNKVEISANLQTNAIVVLTDSYYPNWQAKIDSIPTAIIPANVNSRAVEVTKGIHKIEFIYKPDYVKIWGSVSIIALLFSIFLLKKAQKFTLIR